MKTKLFFLTSVLLGMLAAGCQEDTLQDEPAGKGKILPSVNMEDLSAAMQWYEMHQMEQYATRAGKRHPLFEEVIPDWTSSYSGKNGEGRTVETYLGILNPGIYVTEEASRAYRETQDPRYLKALSRLVVLFPEEDGEAMGFYMTIVPSKSYLEKTDFRPFANNSYTVRDKELDGYVLYHGLDGQLINGWVYEKGKITLAIYGGDPVGDATHQTRAGTMLCTPYYSQICTDYFHYGQDGDPIYDGTSCGSWTLDRIDCEPTGSDGVVPGGGGGGGIGNLPKPGGKSTAYMSENLKKLFTDYDSIPKEGIELFNKALDETLKDCFYKQIFDYLVTQKKFGTIVIKPNMIGLAGVKLGGNGFEIAEVSTESINARNLEHEMIHMVQIRYLPRTRTRAKDGGMMEFERHLLQDLYRYMQIGGDRENKDNQYNWACWGEVGLGRNAYKDEYMNWLDTLTNWGAGIPTQIPEGRFKAWSVTFGKYSRAYNESNGYTYGLTWELTIPFIVNKVNAANCLKK